MATVPRSIFPEVILPNLTDNLFLSNFQGHQKMIGIPYRVLELLFHGDVNAPDYKVVRIN